MLRERSQIYTGHIHVKTEELMYSDRKQPRVDTKVGGTCRDGLIRDLRIKLRCPTQLKLPHTRFARFIKLHFAFKRKSF